SDSTTQVGKSTFIRFCSWLARRAVDRSRSLMMSFLPCSNFLSKSLAFIQLYLSFARTPYRNEPDCSVAVGDDGRPMLLTNKGCDQRSRLIIRLGSDLQQVRVIT